MDDQEDEDTLVLFEAWCSQCQDRTQHQMINLGTEDKPIMADLCTKCDHIC